MIYITGDKHGVFDSLINFSYKNKLTSDDIIFIAGDVGINYNEDHNDNRVKRKLSKIKSNILCVRGNHEKRPEHISSYQIIENEWGKFYQEEEYKNLLFCIDGEEYNIDGKKILCIGGAYSVDKPWRIMYGFKWFPDEQLSKKEQEDILKKTKGEKFDFVISHTCPQKFVPIERLFPDIDQSTVDKSMEKFLDKIEKNIRYKKWYCGHWHTDKTDKKIRFIFNDIIEI